MRFLRSIQKIFEKSGAVRHDLPSYFSLTPPAKSTLLDDVPFSIIDTETTGLESKKDSIISFGAVKMKRNQLLLDETFQTHVKLPILHASMRSSIKVHFITPHELEHAPSIDDALASFLEFIGTDVIVGHHTRFDKLFLQRATRKVFHAQLHSIFIDTAQIAYHLSTAQQGGYYFPNTIGNPDLSLDNLCSKYGIPISNRHDAFSDALITAHLFLVLLGKVRNKQKIKTLQDLMLIAKV